MIPKTQSSYSRLKDVLAAAGIRPAEYYCPNHLEKDVFACFKSVSRLGN